MMTLFAIILLQLSWMAGFDISTLVSRKKVWAFLDDSLSTSSWYYRTQRPLFRQAAKSFRLHYAWAHMENMRADLTYEEIVTRRFESMTKDSDMYGRDDARVEKDKCEMYRFFERNHLAMNKILRHWTSNESIIADSMSGAAFTGIDKFPVFLKCCHLTQGNLKSVTMIKSKEWVAANPDEFKNWVNEKWALKPDDKGRAWREAANKLTDNLVPGFILQAGAPLSFMPHLAQHVLLEMRVEVIFGRAYLAMMGPCMFLLRGETDADAVMVNPVGIQSLVNAHKFLPRRATFGACDNNGIEHHSFIAEEGYMDCVWKLSGHVAKLMQIDYVRVDMMIARGDPNGCLVNELSLSSGFGAFSHKPNIARLWAEMYMLKEYEVFGNKSSKPVYMLDESDLRGAVR